MAKRKNKGLSSLTFKIFRFIILLGLSYILLYPLIFMLSMALRPLDQVADPTIVWIPKSLTLSNIINVFGFMKFGKAFGNTMLIFVLSAAIEVMTCAIVGYGFARFDFPLKKLWFVGVLLTILVPTQCIMIPLTLQIRYFDFFGISGLLSAIGINATVNMLNTPFALYVPSLFASGIRSGLFIFIYRQFFLGLAPELEDAAYIDGCGVFRTFYRIMLPGAKPILIAVFLFSFVWQWTDGYYVRTLAPDLPILCQKLFDLSFSVLGEQSDMFSTMTSTPRFFLLILPVLLLYLFTQRFFTESIERTGVVG